MLFKIELLEQKAQPVLMVRTKTALPELPKAIGEYYGKIMDYMEELAASPADAPYTAYYNLDMQNLDVEMGFPVAKSYPGKGEVQAGEIPAGKFVCALYKGPYAGMEASYKDMFRWMEENGWQSTGVYYEYYYNAPDEVPESELLTRIVLPVKAK